MVIPYSFNLHLHYKLQNIEVCNLMSFKAYYLFELLNQIRQMSIKMNA